MEVNNGGVFKKIKTKLKLNKLGRRRRGKA
jgi:hypothetical protein